MNLTIFFSLIFLLQASYTDIKERSIYTPVCVVFAAAFLLIRFIKGGSGLMILIFPLMVFLSLFLFSRFSKSAFGEGDAWALASLSVSLYIGDFLYTLFLSLVFSGITGVFLILLFKRKSGITLPFMPFVLAGYLVMLSSRGYWNLRI